ncbi:MAG: NAD-dependent epimerase/dehydratase family protein [Chloroflexota bacterium]|nr:MAG: NAD-dependent epimerase/dehydratase family protein [Chloroflexota bacterium]
MRILVTGGAGFIASAIARAYLDLGHEVTILDDLSHGKRERVPAGARFLHMELLDPELEQVFAESAFDLVNHHAAHVSVRESVLDPEQDARVNVLGSLNIFRLAAAHRVPRVIYAASVAGYGEPQELPVTTEHPLRPMSPYGISKAAAEQYGFFYAQTAGLRFIALRYANVYGPNAEVEGEAGVVTIFVNKLSQGQAPTIFGDGEQTRDFVNVQDVVRANVLALEYQGSECFNISTCTEITVNQLFALMKELSGFPDEALYAPELPGEIRRIYLDNSKAKRLLGWHPTVALREGLAQVVQLAPKPIQSSH